VLENYQDMSARETSPSQYRRRNGESDAGGEGKREKDIAEPLPSPTTRSTRYPRKSLRDMAGAREINVSLAGQGGNLEGYFEGQNCSPSNVSGKKTATPPDSRGADAVTTRSRGNRL